MWHVGTNFSSWDPFIFSVILKPPCSFCLTLSTVWIHTLPTDVLKVRLSRRLTKLFGLGYLSSQLIALLRPAIRHQLNSGSYLIGTGYTAKSLIHNWHIAKWKNLYLLILVVKRLTYCSILLYTQKPTRFKFCIAYMCMSSAKIRQMQLCIKEWFQEVSYSQETAWNSPLTKSINLCHSSDWKQYWTKRPDSQRPGKININWFIEKKSVPYG